MGVFGGQAASGSAPSAAAGAAAAAFTCSSSAIRDCCGGPSNTRSHKSTTLSYTKSAYARPTPYCAPYVPKSATLGATSAAPRSTCDLVVQSQQDHPAMNCNSSQTPEQILWQFNCNVLLQQQKRNNPDLVHRTPGCNNVVAAGGGGAGNRDGGNVGSRTTTL